MKRFWAIVFLMVPIFGVLTFVVAPYYNIWFPQDISEHGRVIDQLFMFILWLTGIVFVATEGGAVLVRLEVRRPHEPRAGQVLARQPHAGSRVDDPAGGHAAVHRHLSDERLGRRQDAAAQHPDHRRGHRPAVQLGRPLSRAPTASCTRRTTSSAPTATSICPSGEEVLLMHQERRRAAQLLPAQPADEAGRRARHGAVHVVQGHARRAGSTSSAPSCAAGAITR